VADDLESASVVGVTGETKTIHTVEIEKHPALVAQNRSARGPLGRRQHLADGTGHETAVLVLVYSPLLMRSWSSMIPSINISGLGGHPGT
jgi:hypothetical protein